MLWEQGVDPLESLRPGEQVEHRLAAHCLDVMLNALLLPCPRVMVRMHLGWILG